MRALSLALEGGALTLGMPTFGVITKGFQGLSNVVFGDAGADELKQLQDAGNEIQDKASGLLKPEQVKAPPEEIDAFRSEFGEVLESVGKTLVVFIDNLDRCLPKNAIETLEAVRLFLFMPQTAFIVAADEDMIRHSVSQHFNNPTQGHVTDYLDKLIQVPIRAPRAGIQEIRAYLFCFLLTAPTYQVKSSKHFEKH
ncbi:KAP family P-loop NTPase fold protein [Thalassovita mediterranea]|uniref:Putative P-loop ATPase n=1 Tax=Thalassovita mediterranea TaxID=340021 RepID=A0A0N7M1I6_9RHOB|nr:P-loop NTPase fold protein [Thalassovita mediterranea]CUH83411.1 putative P-loop ATPase [Thalassovita mediterranea]SIS35584.1 KAP family P-loop domain-containing protein [Thalassovita mediterranea]